MIRQEVLEGADSPSLLLVGARINAIDHDYAQKNEIGVLAAK